MDDFLTQYLFQGDLVGFIIAVWTSSMGQMFYGMLIAILTVPLYMRTQSLTYVSILWLLSWGILQTMLPLAVWNIGHVFLILGTGGLLFKLITSRR